jgi:hypothetical protein
MHVFIYSATNLSFCIDVYGEIAIFQGILFCETLLMFG